jgi:transcription initiation factor TFIIIB Brf1 subunit/transcription initiation factor TFIIB
MTSLFPGLNNEPIINDEQLRILSYIDTSSDVDYFKMLTNLSDELEIKKSVKEAQIDELPNEEYTWSCENCEDNADIQILNETILCTRCGEVFEHILDQGPEYRWFSGDDRNTDPTRVGAPQNPLLPESSLGTTMLLRKHHGNAMRKIKRYHTWNLMPYRERNLWGIFEGLHVRAINAGIGIGVLEEAKRLYAQLSALCVCRGTQKEALLAACLYEALKRSGTPRRPKDIGIIFQINIRYVTKGLKQFANLLNLDERTGINTPAEKAKQQKALATAALTKLTTVTSDISTESAVQVSVESRRAKWDNISRSTTTYEHYIDPFVSKLEAPRQLTGTLIALTRQICSRADDMGICPENTPPSLTAAALALSCSTLSIQKTIQEIAAVCDISVVTLHKCLKRLDTWKQKLLETE